MNPDRASLLESIATTIADYRAGEVATPTATHVDRWICQFDSAVQLDMLVELGHVIRKTYLSKAMVTSFLRRLATNTKLVGTDPCAFWKNVDFLDIQQGGRSQSEMLALFSEALSASCGLVTTACGSGGGPYVYLDDAIFAGNRVRNDVIAWLPIAHSGAKLHVIVMAYHRGGQYFAKKKIDEACEAAGKTLKVQWWRLVELEDRKSYISDADVLRPKSLPADPAVQSYIQSLKYPPTLRSGTSLGQAGFFASDGGRSLLEQELLKAGARIRQQSPLLGRFQRPLGNMILETLGFGSTLVTFRNCPNNCPLALWAGDPWYPLFPRRTN
jgi:hypothetical protein